MSLPNNFERLRARFLASLAPIFILLTTVAPASAATRLVAPSGSDSGDCLAVPCASLGYAYSRSGSGDVVSVAAGSYGFQEVSGTGKAVTFKAAPGVVVRQLHSRADSVVFDGFDVDAGGARITDAVFESHGDNATFRNGRIGNVTDEKGALVSGANFTFDRVVFHDVIVTASSVHNECVYAIVVPGFTVRNSRFTQCATMDLFFTHGTWWSPPPPAYGDVTIENNVFEHTTMTEPGSWHYYGLSIENLGPGLRGRMQGFTVRHNTFETPVSVGADGAAANTRWIGNLGSWPCVDGVTYARNVGKACGVTDKRVDPASSTRARTAAFGWLNPAASNFRLTSGSPAVNTGIASDAPALDRDGYARDSRPDAGAHEFGAGPPGRGGSGGPGSSAEPGRRGLRIRSARLRPRVICVRPRRGCAGVSRLRVGVSQRARISVRIKRLRRGRRPRLSRAFGFRVVDRGGRRIRARWLRKGRHRVILRAHRAGVTTKPRVLRLRVG